MNQKQRSSRHGNVQLGKLILALDLEISNKIILRNICRYQLCCCGLWGNWKAVTGVQLFATSQLVLQTCFCVWSKTTFYKCGKTFFGGFRLIFFLNFGVSVAFFFQNALENSGMESQPLSYHCPL